VQFELLSSYANYIQNHPQYSWPQKTKAPTLIAKEMSHPLLPAEQSVSNSYSFNDFRQMILTGSNMSGKSTFLRTIGLNLVLAKRGLTVAAKEFAFYPFQVLSSMNPSDNIHENTSYFQAEIIRLKGLLDSINQENTSLLLLDEILRGTNSQDKKEGTRLFLEKIANLNCIGIVATHDVDISNLRQESSDIFAAYYFESTVEGGELKFDYKLREGVCLTPNATSLMRNYGII
jgi:DNA mismatch repair ATPase MutS